MTDDRPKRGTPGSIERLGELSPGVPKARQFGYIDSLRGLAVLGVLIVHCRSNTPGFSFADLGAKGVQLFYMVSAFTLFISYSTRKDETRPLLSFALRRFFRIAPMFYLMIIYGLWESSGIQYPESDERHVTDLAVITHFLFLHGLSPYWENSLVERGWSVGVEMLFYAVCPLLFVRIASAGTALKYYAVALLVAQSFNLVLRNHPMIPYVELWEVFLYSMLPTQFPVFLMGVVAFFTHREAKFQTQARTVMIAAAITLGFFALGKSLGGFPSITPFSMVNNAAVSFAFLLLILAFARTRFSIRPLSFLGKISFSVYLVHTSVLHWIDRAGLEYVSSDSNPQFASRFLVVLLVASALSTVTFFLVEEPARKIGARLVKNLNSRVGATRLA